MPKKSMDVYEVALCADSQMPAGIFLLHQTLINAGVQSDQIVSSDSGYFKKALVYFYDQKSARNLIRKIKKTSLIHVAISCRKLREKQWKTKWKDTFKSFFLTDNIKIVPSWERRKTVAAKKHVIFIDPADAFGTGLHATTRFVAELVEEAAGTFQSFLDVGTGTGILALIAEKMGATDVEAVDCDVQCVNAARKNILLNKAKAIKVKRSDIAKIKTVRKYDFVAANLITQTLVFYKKKLCALVKPGGYLAISGILKENLSILRREYKKLPLRLVKKKEEVQWAALLYKRIPLKKTA